MTKLASIFAVGGIAILASTGAAFAGSQVPAVTVYSQSPAGQEAYADAILAAAAPITATIRFAPVTQAEILPIGRAGQEAYADNVLASASQDRATQNVATNAVTRQDLAGQEAYADQMLSLAAEQTRTAQLAAQPQTSGIRAN